MKLSLIALMSLAFAPTIFGQTSAPCFDSVSTSDFSACFQEVTGRETGLIDNLSLRVENRKAFPLRCEIQVDSYQAKPNPTGIDDCINDQTGTSRIKQRDRLIFQVNPSQTYESTFATGLVATNEEYYYCENSIGTNIGCARGCSDGQVEKNGQCVPGDCYDATNDILLFEGGSTTKTTSTPSGDNRCGLVTMTYSCSNKVMTAKVTGSDTGVLVNGQCTPGCFDTYGNYRKPSEKFPETVTNFNTASQTCTIVEQTSECRGGYAATSNVARSTDGYTHGTECRTACEIDGRRLKLGEVIEGTWSVPRPPRCESRRTDKVCGDRYVITLQTKSTGASRPGMSRCPGQDAL